MEAIVNALSEKSIFGFHLNVLQCFLGLMTAVLVYRWFKAKKNFPPGPYGLPIVGYLPFLGDDSSSKLIELGKKYGSIFSVRLGREPVVFFNDYETMKEAYSNPNSLDRAPVFGFQKYVGFSEHSGDEWHEQKRFSLQCIKELSVGSQEWEHFIQEEMQKFSDKVHSYGGKAIKIEKDLKIFITNNIISLLFGYPLEPSEARAAVEFTEVALTEGQITSFTTQMPRLINMLNYFGLYKLRDKAIFVDRYINILIEKIAQHRNDKELKDVKDYINLYLEKMQQMEGTKKKHYFHDENLIGNLNALFVGSVDTVYSTLLWLFRLMVKYPEVQQRAQKEIDEFIKDGGRICYENRKKIPYTMAVMMESMRYSSIVPISTGRVAVSDFEVKGYTIPKGTQMAAHLKALHFDPNYWEEPHKFNPDRFLKDGKRSYESNPESFAPFSYGRRICPGEKITWIELVNFFPVLIHRFTIRLQEGETPEFEVVKGLLETLKPQELIFEERVQKK